MRRFRKVPKGWFRKVSEGSGGFRGRCGLLPCNFDRSSHAIVLVTGITLSTWEKPLRNGAYVLKDGMISMLLLLGIPPKLISNRFWGNCFFGGLGSDPYL